jgi:UrcA family protein
MTTANFDLKSNRRTGAALEVIAGCIAAAVANLAAAATPPADVPTMIVHYADLDIATDEGARRLYRRIAAAAERVCPYADIQDLSGLAVSRSCQAQAIARAVQAVSSPRLADVYAAHGKHI